MAWLVFFDQADLESMIVSSPALDRFLDEWAASSKLHKYGGSQTVRTRLIEALRPLAAVRAENSRRQLGISFDELDVSDVTEKDGTLRVVSLAARLASASTVDRSVIEAAMKAAVPQCPHTGLPLTRGRDAMALIGVLLRTQIGTLNKHQTQAGFVERSMRLALAPADFSGTPFAARLDAALAAVAVKPA